MDCIRSGFHDINVLMDSELLAKSMADFCRTCMLSDPSLISVFSIINMSGKVSERKSIASMLSECMSLEVDPSDGLPEKICNSCLKKVISCYLFQLVSQETQLKLQALKQLKDSLSRTENSDNEEIEEVCMFDSNAFDQLEADNVAIDEEAMLGSDEAQVDANNVNHNEESDSTDPTVYKCKFCSKICAHRYALNRHMKIHGDYKELQCHICLKRFATTDAIDRHRRMHTGERPYNCEHCDKDFPYLNMYHLHLKKAHNVIPKRKTVEDREDSWKWSYLCTVCGQRYASNSGLGTHMKNKHPDKREY